MRDYGTAQWDGGDAACDHKPPASRKGDYPDSERKQQTNSGSFGYREWQECGKCGAQRIDAQIGLERTPEEYVATLVAVFREVRRILRPDGCMFLNLGDSFASGKGSCHNPGGGANSLEGHATLKDAGAYKLHRGNKSDLTAVGLKPKDLVGIPWMTAFALRADGWYLRSDIVWCLSGGTRVYARTQKGEMPTMIKDLVRLDPSTVQLWNGSRWTQVLGWSETPRPEQPIELVLRSGERITCTPHHRWPTQRGEVEAGALAVGDVLTTCGLPEPREPCSPDYLPAAEIGWFVGLYLAEGSRSGLTIQIASHRTETGRAERLSRLAEVYGGSFHAHATTPNGMTCNIESRVLNGVIDTYISGRTAKDKHLTNACWRRTNSFLRYLLDGYLEGDGHWDKENQRWRIGFTRNYALEADLRTLSARIGAFIRLKPSVALCDGRLFPSFRGELRFKQSTHHNTRDNGEIVEIRRGRARKFWHIGVADAPHQFALASGVLTCNSKPNPMPESVRDRPTKSHEYVFLLTKSARYYYDADAIAEPHIRDWSGETMGGALRPNGEWTVQAATPTAHKRQAKPPQMNPAGRNARSVWTIATEPYRGAHFAVMPTALVERCIKAGTKPGDTVLDPFAGAGTVGLVADRLQRNAVLIELNEQYTNLGRERITQDAPLFAQVQA